MFGVDHPLPEITVRIGERCPGCHVVCASFDAEHLDNCIYRGRIKLSTARPAAPAPGASAAKRSSRR
jgi:uncharacterized protein (DUF2237 family)